MKKMVGIVTVILALGIFLGGMSYAGDREWATAGKILTGVVAAQVISDWAHSSPGYYYYPQPVYYHYPAYRYYSYPVYSTYRVYHPCYSTYVVDEYWY